jgi:3-keto-disaccharide hydrolase
MHASLKVGLTAIALAATAAAANQKEFKTIFDGTSSTGWILCDKKPLPKEHVQADGLNPHGTGSYLTVHETKYGDFVLDFDYKLSKGCNSGVFVRVSDLDNPVNTGIEVALDDTTGMSMVDSGALYDLVAPHDHHREGPQDLRRAQR